MRRESKLYTFKTEMHGHGKNDYRTRIKRKKGSAIIEIMITFPVMFCIFFGTFNSILKYGIENKVTSFTTDAIRRIALNDEGTTAFETFETIFSTKYDQTSMRILDAEGVELFNSNNYDETLLNDNWKIGNVVEIKIVDDVYTSINSGGLKQVTGITINGKYYSFFNNIIDMTFSFSIENER